MVKNVISTKFNFKEDYKYPFFLVSLVFFLFVPSLAGEAYGDIITHILYILLILSSLSLVSAESKITRLVVYIVGIVGMSLVVIDNFVYTLINGLKAAFMILLFIYFILLLAELLSQIFKAKSITLNIVLGAFTGYVLIGVIGHFIFRLIFLLDPSSFVLPSGHPQELIYFTFITLTTIGYGDISPISDAARNFSIIMGLIGQFYNTVIIAIIIGKFLQK